MTTRSPDLSLGDVVGSRTTMPRTPKKPPLSPTQILESTPDCLANVMNTLSTQLDRIQNAVARNKSLAPAAERYVKAVETVLQVARIERGRLQEDKP